VADPLQNPQEVIRIQTEGIAVSEKNGFGIASGIVNPQHFLLNLILGQLTVLQMLEQSAEGTGVVGTAHCNRQHIRCPFHGRTADLTLVIHTVPSRFSFIIA
jgi:hypothetical protein